MSSYAGNLFLVYAVITLCIMIGSILRMLVTQPSKVTLKRLISIMVHLMLCWPLLVVYLFFAMITKILEGIGDTLETIVFGIVGFVLSPFLKE
jgi:ABC-type amino acid transport system permease subunit